MHMTFWVPFFIKLHPVFLPEQGGQVLKEEGNAGKEGPDLSEKRNAYLVRVVPQCHPDGWCALCDVNVFVNVHHILPLRMHLHQDLVLPHHLHNLPNIRSRLLQQLELLPKKTDCRNKGLKLR
jgi:hypothetical protein